MRHMLHKYNTHCCKNETHVAKRRQKLKMKTVTKAVQLTFNIKGYRVGECHHRAKISDAMVDIVYSLYEERNPDGTRRYGTRKICEITGIPRSTVCDIVSGRTRSQPIERARTVKVSIEVPDEG